jgi:diguanylate cyclase (GGDEF)-like protein/putative nucleotidyltransferase with HDIG domain
MAIDAKDQYYPGHSQRVCALALALANEIGMQDPKELEALRAASLLHDIGKLSIPDHILQKPDTLSQWDTDKIKTHTNAGADLLAAVQFPYPVVPFVRHHQERWDGEGYPAGLKRDSIPLGARILCIANCFDALRSDRPYRKRLSLHSALDYVTEQSGKSFDPRLVQILVNKIDEFEKQIAASDQLPTHLVKTIQDTWKSQVPHVAGSLFEHFASSPREIQAVLELSKELGRSLNVKETSQILTEQIRNLVPYDACSIYVIHWTEKRLVASHTAGKHADAIARMSLHLNEGFSGLAASRTQSIISTNPADDFRSQPDLKDEFKSGLSSPLVVDDQPLGVITLYSVTPLAYQVDHLRVLQTISYQAASAIHNAVTYEAIHENAYTDLLTGLPNRRYLQMLAPQEFGRASHVDHSVTLLMMDLEDFKEVNDRYGHKVGDTCLAELATVLSNQLRRSDTCLRYGGDEFVGILPGIPKSLVSQTIRRIQNAVDRYEIQFGDGQSLKIGVSIGSATFPEDGRTLEVLLAVADQSMYRDKLRRAQARKHDDT